MTSIIDIYVKSPVVKDAWVVDLDFEELTPAPRSKTDIYVYIHRFTYTSTDPITITDILYTVDI